MRGYTLLDTESATAPVVVVDRPGWVQANVDGLRMIIDPLVEKLRASRPESGAFATAVGSRVTGLEAGGLFAFLSNKVLGQFDPFFTGLAAEEGRRTTHGGRLLLVAPNIVQVERELGVDPADFRLWVCLHEETHRVQFTAVPWLRGAPAERDGERPRQDRPRPRPAGHDAARGHRAGGPAGPR